MRGGVALARLFEARAKTESEARSHFVGALALLAQKIERTAEAAARTEFMDAAAENEDAITNLIAERLAKVGDMFIEFTARLHDEFGGGAGSGSANVRDKIGDSEIGLVADAGDDGNFRIEDSAGDNFFVEGPQVFDGAATAREDQDVDKFSLIEKSQRTDNFLGGAFSLHAHRENGEMQVVKTAAKDADDVADGGALRRGDKSDAAWEKGERVFCVR